LGRLSIVIPKASTIRTRNSSDPIGCHGRTASYLTAPAQIPACGITALGSSEILASVKDKLVLPSLLFPAVRFAFVPPVLLARQMFPLQKDFCFWGQASQIHIFFFCFRFTFCEFVKPDPNVLSLYFL